MRCIDAGPAWRCGAALNLLRAAGEGSRRQLRTTPSRSRHVRLRVLWPIPIVASLVLTALFVAEPVRVTSNSMSPTYRAGDQLVVDKISPRAHVPHRRDVIAFRLRGSDSLIIKRVVAIAGDAVGLDDGVLVVNGSRVQEAFVDYNLMDATYFGPVTVPAGSVFTMGDNRADSIDSRRFGAVPTNDIVGRVMLRVWPP